MIRYDKCVGRVGVGLLAAMVLLGGCGAAKQEPGGTSSFGDAVAAVAMQEQVSGGNSGGVKNSGGSENRVGSGDSGSGGDSHTSTIDENIKGAASGGNQKIVDNELTEDEGNSTEMNVSSLNGDSTGAGSNQVGADGAGKSEQESVSGKSAEAGSNVQIEGIPAEGKSVLLDGSTDNGSASASQKPGTKAANSSGVSVGADRMGAGEQGVSLQNNPRSSNGSKQEKPAKSGTDSDADTGKKTSGGASSAKYPQIGWHEFFDNEEQTTPSNRFWDLSDERKTVQIKGFMGEVLSFDQNWFLLIPEPGAECPFDNGDETYWNKIMIVFVKDGSKLRYTNKPLKLTGRLDVGIKVDESGYKTMFRLYDAKFEEIKE